MKRILTILFLIISISGIGQSIVNRATQSQTVADSRLQATFNLLVPRYNDTTAANIPYFPGAGGNRGLDSSGQIIFTYDINNFWCRANNPKRWVRVANAQVLPDGVYSGGDVGWTGTGLDFYETAATYILNGAIINSPTTFLTLVASDPTFSRIDLIGLGPTGPVVITGTPAASPQEPSYNPQVFIRRAAVLVEAGALTPTIITNIIYDENLGTPSEWNATVTGGAADFNATAFPFHLTKYANITVFDSSRRIKFNFSDTLHSEGKNSIVGFVRLATALNASQNYFIQLFNAGVAVSNQLPFTGFGLFRQTIAQYQPVVFPLPAFGAANIIFDEIRIIPTGPGFFPVTGFDFFQFQTGFSPIVTQRDFGVQDNVSYGTRSFNLLQNGFTLYNGRLSIGTNAVAAQAALYLEAPNSTTADIVGTSLLTRLGSNGTIQIRPKLSSGGYKQLSLDANTYLLDDYYSPGNSLGGRIGLGVLDAGVSNEFYFKPVSAGLGIPTYLALYDSIKLRGVRNVATPDSFATITGGVITRTAYAAAVAGNTLSNIGSGYRWAVPITNNVKTLFVTNGIFADSTSNTNANTLQVDSLTYTTRLRSQKMADSVTALIGAAGTNANIGTGFRLAVFGTRNIKSIAAGANISIDSSVSGTLTIASSAGSPGTLTSFAFTNGSGFTGSVTNSTTTPTLALTTSLTSGRVPYIGASGALSETANLTWDNTNQRFNIGGGSAVTYLGLHASTTTQSSINLGNGGTAPTSPVNADMWVASNHLMAQLGGSTFQIDQQPTALTINSTAISSGTAGRILFQNASNQVSQNTNLFWDNTNNRLQINGAAVAAALALPASTTTQAPLNLGNGGTAPTSPNNADVWVASNHLFARLNGVSTQLDAQTSAGVTSAIGTANQVNVSAATGAVTFSLPQSIATTSTPTFRTLTVGGTAATPPLIFTTNTDAAAAAGRWYYNTTRLGFSLAATILRVPLTNDVAPANGQIPIGNGTNYTVSAISPSNNTMVITNGAGSIVVGLNMAFQTLTDGATITWNAANGFNATVTLGGVGRTLARSNWVNGATYTLRIVQDATGSRTITTWPTGIRWPNGVAPVLTTAANSVNIVSFLFDGTNVYGTYQLNPFQ